MSYDWDLEIGLLTQFFCVGHAIADICLIFRILPSHHPYTAETLVGSRITDQFLAYVRRYDIIPRHNPELDTGLILLKRATRSNGELAGDIIPLDQLRSLVDLTPRFGEKANRQLTNSNSLAFANEFWVNRYFDKELLFDALSQ